MEFYRLRLKDHWFTEFYYLSPTDDTDFFASLKILAMLGNLSKLNCPRLSQEFIDFYHPDLTIFIKILFTLGIRKINFTSALAYNKIRSLTTSKSLYG